MNAWKILQGDCLEKLKELPAGVVALKNFRDFIGIELNAEYVEMARRRIGQVSPMFAKESV